MWWKRLLTALLLMFGVAALPLVLPGNRLILRAYLGNSKAMYKLGIEYGKISNLIVRPDGEKSIYWFKRAAEKGELDAYLVLGKIGTKEGPMHWFLLGAEKGHRGCMVEVAKAYEDPYGLYKGYPHDQAKADYWWRKAAEARKAQEGW